MLPDRLSMDSLRRLAMGEHEGRDPSRREVVKIIAAATAFLLMPACRESTEPVVEGEPDTDFTLMTNPSDPLLLRAVKDGRTVEYFGTRDGRGAALMVTHVAVTEPSGSSTWYTLRSDGRPLRAAAHNGTGFEFTWVSSTQLSVTALAPDGRNQVTTNVDLTHSAVTSRAPVPHSGDGLVWIAEHAHEVPRTSRISNEASLASLSARGNQRVTLVQREGFDEEQQGLAGAGPARSIFATGSHQRTLGAAAPNVTIQVLKCGGPSTQTLTVSVRVTDAAGGYLAQFPAYPSTGGTYSATIPSGLAPTLNPSSICESIASAVGNVCDWIISQPAAPAIICSALAAAVAATGPLAVVLAGPIGDACFSVAAGLELYCATLGGSAVPGAPSPIDAICRAPELNRTFTADIRLAPVALGLPNDLIGPSVIAPGAGPYPTLRLDLGSKPAVRSLVLTPPNPHGGQSYTATVQLSCLPTGTEVKLSVVGTDNYTDSATQRIGATQQSGTFTLNVPGGGTGIRDVVTVSVAAPNVPVVTFTAALVFG